MKTSTNRRKSSFSQFLGRVTKNFAMLFEAGEKREFQRLKDFITS